MKSEAETPERYLEELPEERARVVAALREAVAGAMPEGYEESMRWGMISWEVPLERFPETYNGEPLGYVALAAQKNHYALYMHGLYMDEESAARFRERWKATGARLDMGKSCVRFKTLEEVPLQVVEEAVAAMPVEAFLDRYRAVKGG